MQNLEQKIAELEALLFIHGEPLAFKKVVAVLELEKTDTDAVVEEFKKRLEGESSGLTLVSDGEKIQLVTKPQFGKILEGFVKEELSEDLTLASLEALAIVAYFEPISRARIDYLRGVNSIFILRSLLIRGLVERFPDPERPNTFLYRPTFETWRRLGLKGKEDLPEFSKYSELLKKFEAREENKTSPETHNPRNETTAQEN